MVDSDILGVMEVFSGEIQQPDTDLLQMLTAIGSQIGQFMKRKQAEETVFQERYLLHTLMDNVPDSIYFKDARGPLHPRQQGHGQPFRPERPVPGGRQDGFRLLHRGACESGVGR